MPKVNENDIPDIASTYSMLTARTDSQREKFSNSLLSIYTPVTSGLLFLSIQIKLQGNLQKSLFLIIVTTSACIVLISLFEKFMYYLTAKSGAQMFVDYFNATGKHINSPVHGRPIENLLLIPLIYILVFMVVINILSVVIFVFTRVA